MIKFLFLMFISFVFSNRVLSQQINRDNTVYANCINYYLV